jgi:hypothetical protein
MSFLRGRIMEDPFAQALRLRTQQHLSRLASETRRAVLDAAVALVAALMALGATGCAVAALWLLLAPRIGAAGAALAAAVALLAVGGAVIGLRRLFAPQPPVPGRLSTLPAPGLSAAAAQSFGANKMALILAALAAGVAAAEAQRGK